MEKKELIVLVALIVAVAAILLVSGIFYFSFALGTGVTGHVVKTDVTAYPETETNSVVIPEDHSSHSSGG